MACCGSSSNTIIQGTEGIFVSGSGTPSDPYIISGEVGVEIKGATTETIAVQVAGLGSQADPFVVYSTLIASLGNLADVVLPDTPTNGHVLMWSDDSWIAGVPPPSPAGAVNVGAGILGTGALGDPLKIAVSDTTSTSTSGTAIYVDSAGQIRAVPVPAGSVAWTDITGKPTAFTPSPHTHAMADLPGMRSGTAAPANSLGVNGDWYAQYI